MSICNICLRMFLLTWNVGLITEWFRYLCMGRILNIKKTIESISTHINQNEYDTIFFQELYLKEFELLSKKIDYKFKYCNNILGLSIVSNHNLEIVKIILFNKSIYNYFFGTFNGFIILYDNENDMYLVNIHLNSCFLNYILSNELDILKEELDKLNKEKKIIFGGDFNISRYYSLILKHKLKIEFNKLNNYNSYNYIFDINIDYIFCYKNNKSEELKCTCIDTLESDHYPILTEI